MDLYEEFLGLIDVLEKHKIDYAVCGGIAVTLHGHVRSTKDIDILVRREDFARVCEAVKERGFTVHSAKIPFRLGTQQEQEVHRVLKIDGADVLILDLMIVTPAFQDAWAGRGIFEWKGRRLRAVSKEGIAQMKRLSGRAQDKADLEGLGME